MKIQHKPVLIVLLILSCIIFIGVCIEAGGFITNAIFSLANPAIVPRLWQQVDLSNLFTFNRGYFFTLILTMGIVAVLRAWLFFLIIKMLLNKKLNIAEPFSKEVRRFIVHLACIALLIGLFSMCGINYTEWLVTQGVKIPDTQYLRLGGADVWLFMAIILFVIAQVFKKGIEIQAENELTI